MSEPSERAHYSATIIEKLDPGFDYDRDPRGPWKPRGLWYSAPVDEDGWEHWCKAEEFSLGEHKHLIELDLSGMLVIRQGHELVEFARSYAQLEPSYAITEPDWKRLRAEFTGIEIAPYQWAKRLEPGFSWYYGWDCASGCVWDLAAVRGWRHVKRGG